MDNANAGGLVVKGKSGELPAGAIRITRFEAEKKLWDLVYSWTPRSEIWSLRYGHAVLSCFSAVSALLITSYYRKSFKLGSFGRITTQLPTCFIPSLSASVFHVKFVASSVLLQDECPVCLQTRSAVIQLLNAIVIPGILAPLVSMGYAYNYGELRLPEPSRKNARELFHIYWKITKRYKRRFAFLTAANALIATFITYKQGVSFLDMHMKLINEKMQRDELIKKNYPEIDKKI